MIAMRYLFPPADGRQIPGLSDTALPLIVCEFNSRLRELASVRPLAKKWIPPPRYDSLSMPTYNVPLVPKRLHVSWQGNVKTSGDRISLGCLVMGGTKQLLGSRIQTRFIVSACSHALALQNIH